MTPFGNCVEKLIDLLLAEVDQERLRVKDDLALIPQSDEVKMLLGDLHRNLRQTQQIFRRLVRLWRYYP